jgi:hypothetical protein
MRRDETEFVLPLDAAFHPSVIDLMAALLSSQ